MLLSDADYFTRRAEAERERAASAADQNIAGLHVRLSDLYLDHARAIAGDELTEGAPRLTA